jgi:Tol biopolymer transport system component
LPKYSPDGAFIVFSSATDQRVARIPARGGEIEFLAGAYGTPRWAPQGEALYFRKTSTGTHDLWALPVKAGRERRVTDLVGRRGNVGWGLATDGKYLYFTWSEAIGDIWVMDLMR